VLFEKIKKHYGDDLRGKHFALWGLAFKPDTDDIREAPALYLIDDLLAAGATVAAFDPEAGENVKKKYKDENRVSIVDHEYDVLPDADALLIATEWAAFRTPEFEKLKQSLKQPVIFDGRNLYEPSDVEKLGFRYESIGRQAVEAK
jgi:UDPglucose 6-dehydrogenase